jgi:alkylation response protein AidB-like acyl-CoA dehydrogenase
MSVEENDRRDPIALARLLSEEFRAQVIVRERLAEEPTEELGRIRGTALVNLQIPAELGGSGGSWHELARVVLEFSKVDPNIGLLLAHHYRASATPLRDLSAEGVAVQRASAANRWIWGDLTGPPIGFVAAATADGGFLLSGTKQHSDGSATADVTLIEASRGDDPIALVAYVSTDRAGIAFDGSWDQPGLRRSARQPVSFDNVAVRPEEVLSGGDGGGHARARPLRAVTGALLAGAVSVGAAWGALDSAREYLRTNQSPRPGQDAAIDDPLAQTLFGELVAQANAVVALQDEVALRLDGLYAADHTPAESDIAEAGAHAAAFRSFAGQSALASSNQIFDALAAGAAARRVGLDRYWRDVRLHTTRWPTRREGDSLAGEFVLGLARA